MVVVPNCTRTVSQNLGVTILLVKQTAVVLAARAAECDTFVTSGPLALAAETMSPRRRPAQEQCFKKFHPKVRNHGEGPY